MEWRKYIALMVVAIFVLTAATPLTQVTAKTTNNRTINMFTVLKSMFGKNKAPTGFNPLDFIRTIFRGGSSHINKPTPPTPTPQPIMDGVDAPTWAVGDTWTYDIHVKFNYDTDWLKVDVTMSDLKFTVTDVQSDRYKVPFTCKMTGKGSYDTKSVIGVITGTLDSTLSGTVYVRKSDIAILEADDLTINGKLSAFTITGTSNIHDLTPIAYLSFPFDVGSKWTREKVSGFVYAKGGVPVYQPEFDLPIFVKSCSMECTGKETVTVPAGSIECYKIVGDMGSTANIWYSPEVGNIVKAVWKDFKLQFEEGNDDGYNMEEITIELKSFGRASNPPETPAAPSGPTSGEAGTEYSYSASTTDPDGDQIKYVFDWGDGTTSETGFVDSGTSASASHSWRSSGAYEVRVMARDSNGAESKWSNPTVVNIAGGNEGYVNLTVNIYKIKALSDLDPWWKGGADFTYKLSVYNGYNWVTRIYDCKDQKNTVKPNKSYKFRVFTGEPKITIKVWDRDPVVINPLTGSYIDYHDLADVSAYPGGGTQNKIEDVRGAIYHGVYKLLKHRLSQDFNEDNDDWGTDGSCYTTAGTQRYKTKVWFKISDDYRPPSSLKIIHPGDGSVFYTGDEIKFEAKIEGGLPPYSWFWEFDTYNNGPTSTQASPTHVYDKQGDYWVKVTVTDSAGQTISDGPIILHIFKNSPPEKPSKPYGPTTTKAGQTYKYQTTAHDPDGHRLAYGWDWDGDGVVDEWDDNNGEYYRNSAVVEIEHTWGAQGLKYVKVKAKDTAGAESPWSDPLPVYTPYTNEKQKPTAAAGGPYKITKENPKVTFDAS
ncbi:MAG: hypothetical protein DRN01_06100, partial [Thermoplasmata archaeon]